MLGGRCGFIETSTVWEEGVKFSWEYGFLANLNCRVFMENQPRISFDFQKLQAELFFRKKDEKRVIQSLSYYSFKTEKLKPY